MSQMIAGRGRVGHLSDGRVHIFLCMESKLSHPGEIMSGQVWRLKYCVAQYDDCPTASGDSETPSVFQCFAYALQYTKEHLQDKDNDSWLALLDPGQECCGHLEEQRPEQEQGGTGQQAGCESTIDGQSCHSTYTNLISVSYTHLTLPTKA